MSISIGVWRRTTDLALRARVTKLGVGILLIVGGAFVGAFSKWGFKAYGGQVSWEVLQELWKRNGLGHIGTIADILSVLTITTCVAVALAACLTLEETNDFRVLAQHTKDLDRLLYSSAGLLAAGIFEMAAFLSWPFSPFLGMTDTKALVETSDRLNELGLFTNGPATLLLGNGTELLRQAQILEGLKHLARALVVIGGVGFTLLLASIFGPALFLLNNLSIKAARGESSEAKSERAITTTLQEYELQPNASHRIFRLVITLGPLLIVLLSGLIDIFGRPCPIAFVL